jgi:hypothetical protein
VFDYGLHLKPIQIARVDVVDRISSNHVLREITDTVFFLSLSVGRSAPADVNGVITGRLNKAERQVATALPDRNFCSHPGRRGARDITLLEFSRWDLGLNGRRDGQRSTCRQSKRRGEDIGSLHQ